LRIHVILAALFFFAILTLWVPAYWPVAVFQVGVFTLAIAALWRVCSSPPRFVYPLAPLGFAVAWGLFQLWSGRTAYAFDTVTATVQWATFLAVFLTGICVFREAGARAWFRRALIWFGFVVAVEATAQNFTAGGKVFWLFLSGYTEFVMGPIVYHNHYAAFIEVILPMALYEALRRQRHSLIYTGMAAAMYGSVIASASRAGTILTTAEIVLVTGLLWGRGLLRGRAAGFYAILIAVLLAAFSAAAGWETVWNRFQQRGDVRVEFAAASLHMIADHPWSGTGLGTWPTVYPKYAGIDLGAFANEAHSDWLQWTADGGIPLGVAMATLLIWCLLPAWRTVWGLGVVAVLVHAGVDYTFSRPALGSLPVAILAMMAEKDLADEPLMARGAVDRRGPP
jgi:O-antigen ligase